MKCIRPTGAPIRLTLSRDRTASIKQGHPWIFRDYLVEAPPASPGSLALLRAKDGAVIAQGMYDSSSHLVFRTCAVNPDRFDESFVAARIEAAVTLRKRLFSDCNTTGFRLLNGEGDNLPGLVCDVYGDQAIFQLDGDGPAGFWNLDGIASNISKSTGVANFFRKHRSGESESLSTAVLGAAPSGEVSFRENGLKFSADVLRGQKTGFFFDQRDNRQRVGAIAKDRTVLNLFGYTGGFSIYAGCGGARHVTTVDLAKPAIQSAAQNWRLNGLEDSKHTAVAADAFEFVERSLANRDLWDLVIVDPPSFAPGKQHFEKARSAYVAIFTGAAKVTEKGGILAASSCSSHVSADQFLEICAESVSRAKRRATVLGVYGQPEDHPFPIACQELRYLKFVTLLLD